MDKKKVGDTFLDLAFRRWEVILVGDDFYDCQFVECLDGYIPNTPKFKLFDCNDPLFLKIVSPPHFYPISFEPRHVLEEIKRMNSKKCNDYKER